MSQRPKETVKIRQLERQISQLWNSYIRSGHSSKDLLLEKRDKVIHERKRLLSEFRRLPVQLEGFLVTDDGYFVGCPNDGDDIEYFEENDIEALLGLYGNKYIRITVEAVEDRIKCKNCKRRFRCFTE